MKKCFEKLEKVKINDSDQWVLVRGRSLSAPLIIHVQAGPGFPGISEYGAMGRLLRLEDDFLVAYWDQRGCGKSYVKDMDASAMNFPQLTRDVISITGRLIGTYKKEKAALIGYSIGASLAVMAASANPGIFSSLFLAGIDIDIAQANIFAINFIKNRAMASKNRKLIKAAAELEKTPVSDSKTFRMRARLLTDLGGIKTASNYKKMLFGTIGSVLFNRAYGIGGLIRTVRGMEFCQDALVPGLETLNLFDAVKRIGVPVHFIQGRNDGIAPPDIAMKFYNSLEAPVKTIDIFENSAHMPQYDESRRFRNLIQERFSGYNNG